MIEKGKLNLEHFKAQLLEKKRSLVQDSEDSSAERAPVELDQTKVGRLSRMDALQGQAMALALSRRRENEIVRIDQALKRIENNDYGYCVRCDEEIALKRLELDPAAPTCISCAENS